VVQCLVPQWTVDSKVGVCEGAVSHPNSEIQCHYFWNFHYNVSWNQPRGSQFRANRQGSVGSICDREHNCCQVFDSAKTTLKRGLLLTHNNGYL